MSYSFSVQGGSKDDALAKVAEQFTQIVASQPVHEADSEAVLANAKAMVSLLRDDDTQDVGVSMSGSIWKTDDGVQQVSCQCNATLVTR